MIHDYLSLTRCEIETIVKNGKAIAVLPLGAIEQHGAHLPVGTDSYTSRYYTDEALRRSEADADILVLPQLCYSLSVEHANYPATIFLNAETLLALLRDIGQCLLNTGITRLLILNGHGGNDHLLQVAGRELYRMGLRVYATMYTTLMDTLKQECHAVHADKVETSLMLAIDPVRVRTDKITKETDASVEKWMQLADCHTVIAETWLAEDVAVDGVIGEASKANAENGKEWLETILKELVKGVQYVIEKEF